MARISATLLPSIGNMVFLSFLTVLVLGSDNRLLNDGDTGYHIRTGEVILESWRIPTHDIFSAHDPALEWTAHEWLADTVPGNLAEHVEQYPHAQVAHSRNDQRVVLL